MAKITGLIQCSYIDFSGVRVRMNVLSPIIMVNKSIENRDETPGAKSEAKKPRIVQVGSRAGFERDERGDLKTTGDVVGIAQNEKNGNVLGTLQGTKLMRTIHEMIAKATADGEPMEELVIDLTRAQSAVKENELSEQNLSDEEIAAILLLRNRLKTSKGINLVLTGLKAETIKKLRAEGMEERGLQMVIKGKTRETLENKPTPTKESVDQAA